MTEKLYRIAPTPSGYLHTGNLYNFILTALLAKKNAAKLLLRIDDLDSDRVRTEYLEDIFRVLEWLGIGWDTGPMGPDDFNRNWSQALRRNLYEYTLEELRQKHLLFGCECTRTMLAQSGSIYPGTCIEKGLMLDNADVSWRIKLNENPVVCWQDETLGRTEMNLSEIAGAFVVRRRDGIPAYQVASLADDIHFGVTHIVRGADLLESTAMQLYLSRCLSNRIFEQTLFMHHGLLTGSDGSKLSKSAGKTSQSIMLSTTPQKVFLSFAEWVGLPPESADSFQTLVQAYSNHSSGG